MRNNIIHMKPLFIFIFLVGSLTCFGQARFDTVYTNLPNQTPTILFCESTLCSWIGYLYEGSNCRTISQQMSYEGELLSLNRQIIPDTVNCYPGIMENSINRISDDYYTLASANFSFQNNYYEFFNYSPIKNELSSFFQYTRDVHDEVDFARMYPFGDHEYVLIEYIGIGKPGSSPFIWMYLLDGNFTIFKSKYYAESYSRLPVYVDFSYPVSLKVITENYRPNLETSQIEFIEYDSNFEIVQSKVIDLNLRLRHNAVTRDVRQNYIIAADSFYIPIDSQFYINNSVIYSINDNFDKINWRIELDKSLIPKGAKYYGNRVISSADSSVFYAIGNVAYGLYEAQFMSYLLKFNTKGEVLWTKFYKPKDIASNNIQNQSFTDACLVKDNRIMIVGYIRDKEKNLVYPWVLQLDENGCVNDDDCNEVVSEKSYDLKNKGISLYPNPSSGEIKILSNGQEIDRIILHSIYGKELRQFKINNQESTIDLNLSELTQGIYFISCYDRFGNIATIKWIKN